MGLSDSMRQRADAVWHRILAHPFVVGLGDGTLAVSRFKYYLRQDYLFLIDYSRVLAIASAKAPDLEGMTRFGELLHATLSKEMQLHRTLCQGFGISPSQLERTKIAPATSAYARFLVSVAYEGSIREIGAALLPCQWGYSEIGRHLVRTGNAGESNPYAEWIQTYASQEFAESAEWLKAYVDDQSRHISGSERRRLHELYLLSSRYEYDFWEMGWHRKGWMV